jgi:hypothetical protein
MSNWFARLFAPNLVGRRVHAWSYGPYGRSHVTGEVVEETDTELVLDVSVPDRQQFNAFVRVWKHDARSLGEPLPIDTTALTHEVST